MKQTLSPLKQLYKICTKLIQNYLIRIINKICWAQKTRLKEKTFFSYCYVRVLRLSLNRLNI